jgi:hypothetical protein
MSTSRLRSKARLKPWLRLSPISFCSTLILNGEQSFPVAEILKSRSIPFVFLSGYEASHLDEAFSGTKVLEKPFRLSDLETVLEEAFANPDSKPKVALR